MSHEEDDSAVGARSAQQSPMSGVRVLEVAAWIAGPATGGILADWGADVIKVEPCTGDPLRGILTLGEQSINPVFELDNRGKRSIAIDISTPPGLAILLSLVARTDVLLTNFRPSALTRLRIDPALLLERFPRLIYASVTGYGHESEHRNRPSYDLGGFWARSGAAAAHTVADQAPPTLRGGFGDHITASTLAGGIAAALFERERTGRGRHVTTSLIRTGVYAVSQDFNVKQRVGITFPTGTTRAVAGNPMMNSYRSSDDKWFWLLGLQPDRQWPLVMQAIGRQDLVHDDRFASLADRRANAAVLITELDATFATRTRDEWEACFSEYDIWYEPVLSIEEAIDDPIVAASGAFIEMPGRSGPIPSVASPVDFVGSALTVSRPTPELGEHTDDILVELGHDWDQIVQWKIDGAVL